MAFKCTQSVIVRLFVCVLFLLVVLLCTCEGSDHEQSSDGNDTHEAVDHSGIHVATLDFDHVSQPLIVSVFMMAVVICKIGFHKANFLSSWMPESCVLILLGIVVGAILHFFTEDIPRLSANLFFLYLLPPCILEAAYGLHDGVFFANIGTVLIYAVLGTLLNFFAIAPALYYLGVAGAMGPFTAGSPAAEITLMQCFVFASLIVAVDPVAVLAIFQEIGVNNVLYFLVFGESLFNDAVTVVLYKTITTLNAMSGPIPYTEYLLGIAAFFTVSLGGLSIGLIFGFLSAVITRFTQHVRVVEPLAILFMAYCSYLMAELFHFSGIISMIGCGLIQKQYAFHNISNNSGITIKYFTKMLSSACDSIIFMFLGISLVRDDHEWNTLFVLWSCVLCLAIRMLFTFSITLIANHTYRDRKINLQEQFIMGYGGLRGGVAFCLVAMLDSDTIGPRNMFQTTTLFIILFTVFVQGMSIKPFVKCLRVESGDSKVISMIQEINQQVTDQIMVFIEELCGHLGHNTVKEKMYALDQKVLKPLLQREPMTKDEAIMEIYQQILMQQYYESLYGPKSATSSFEVLPAYNLVRISSVEQKEAVHIRKQSHAAIMHSFANTARNVVAAQRMSMAKQADRTSGLGSSLDTGATDDIEMRNYATVPAPVRIQRPSLFRAFSEKRAGPDEDAEGGARKRRSTFFRDGIGRLSMKPASSDDVFVANPTAKDLKKWLIKPDSRNVYSRLQDRNLKNDDETDLVHRLHEGQRRHERMVRGRSIYSEYSSMAGSRLNSISEDKGGLGEFQNSSSPQVGEEQRQKVLAAAAATARHRHKTTESSLSPDRGGYKPRYRSKAKLGLPGPGPKKFGGSKVQRLESVKDEDLDDPESSASSVRAEVPESEISGEENAAEQERLLSDTEGSERKSPRSQLRRQDADTDPNNQSK